MYLKMSFRALREIYTQHINGCINFSSFLVGNDKEGIKTEKALLAPFLFLCSISLYRKTFAAAAGAGCVRVMEVESFAVQSVREIQFSAGQVQE